MYKLVTVGVAVLALAGTGAAFAKSAPSSSAHATSAHKMHRAHHADRMQNHLAKLKAKLKITTAQASAWSGFAQAVEHMRPAMKKGAENKKATLTAPEVFKFMAMRAEQRAKSSQTLATAAGNLYGKLSTAQQGTWNKLIARMHAKAKHRKHDMRHRWHKHHEMHHAKQG